MAPQTYVAIIIVLFIILALGWSTTLFAFISGAVVGVLGVRMYDSEILNNLATYGGDDTLRVKGVYATHPITLIESTGKKLTIRNNPKIPHEKDVPEYPIGVTLPCYDRSQVYGVPLDLVLVRKIHSDKNMLIAAGEKKYYLELSPKYTKRDENQSIVGVCALKTGDDKPDLSQATEKHSRMLELLAKLLNKFWCGKVPKGVATLGASKHTSTIPDQGPIALLSNVGATMHTISGADFLDSDDKNRGDIEISYDDETIKLPVIEKGQSDVANMPLMHKIEDMAENAKLLIVIQDYITSGITRDRLPRNVIYIGQTLRDDVSKKLYLNAFVHSKSYDYIIKTLESMMN